MSADVAEAPVADYTVVKAADEPTSPQTPAQAAADAAHEPAEGRPVVRRAWHSGYCGPGPCRDGQATNKAGEPIRFCRYVAVNGEKAEHKTSYCACDCHTDPERAGQALVQGLDA